MSGAMGIMRRSMACVCSRHAMISVFSDSFKCFTVLRPEMTAIAISQAVALAPRLRVGWMARITEIPPA